MVGVLLEQHINVKYLLKLGKSTTETLPIFLFLSMCAEMSTLSHTQIFKWYKWFKKRHEDVEDDPYLGRPSTEENIEEINKVIR